MKTCKVKNIAISAVLLSSLLYPVLTAVGQVTSLFVENYPERYVVQDDDTIADIASQFLSDPDDWDDVWLPSPGQAADDINTGDIIRVDFVNGSPKLISQRGDIQVERLSPEMREIALLGAIPEISLESIASSFTSNRIVPADDYTNAPSILSPINTNIVIGANEDIFARGDWPEDVESFDIYRQINSFQDPETKESIGVELETVGTANVVRDEEDGIKRLLVSNSKREIKVGDRLLVREESTLDPIIYPTEPINDVEGLVLSMTNTERMASQLDTVLIDVGSQEGLEMGNILSINQPGQMVVDMEDREQKGFFGRFKANVTNEKVQMPSNRIGTLLVYRVFDRMSYGVILSSNEPSRIGDMVGNP